MGVGGCLQEEQDGDPAAEAEHGGLVGCGCDCGCVYGGSLACARCSPNGPDVCLVSCEARTLRR